MKWADMAGPLLGAFIATVSALVIKFFEFIMGFRKERAILLNAIKSEISSLISLAERNEYRRHILAAIEFAENQKFKPFFFTANRSPTKIYDANLAKIGMLEPQVDSIVKFYMLVTSFLEDNDEMRRAFFTLGQKEPDQIEDVVSRINLETVISYHERVLKTLDEILNLGREIAASIDE